MIYDAHVDKLVASDRACKEFRKVLQALYDEQNDEESYVLYEEEVLTKVVK